MTKTDKLHSMRFSSLLYPGVRQRIAMKRSPMFMTPAPCWFPMTLMTLSLWHQMMMMASTKKSRKKKDNQGSDAEATESMSSSWDFVCCRGDWVWDSAEAKTRFARTKRSNWWKIQGRLLPRSVILFSFVRVAEVGIGGQIQVCFLISCMLLI